MTVFLAWRRIKKNRINGRFLRIKSNLEQIRKNLRNGYTQITMDKERWPTLEAYIRKIGGEMKKKKKILGT